MSIRIRTVNGTTIAVCAARSLPKVGDIYLDDAAHHALSVKFDLDFGSMGFMNPMYLASDEAKIMEEEESNNSNRDWWDRTYGGKNEV